MSSIGRCVYLSHFEKQKASLKEGNGALIFFSLHIPEEYSPNFPEQIRKVCRWLTEQDYRIIADIDDTTPSLFGMSTVQELKEQLGLYAIRPDFGFSQQEICNMARQVPIALNASTRTDQEIEEIALIQPGALAMFNFYPRAETGMDSEFLFECVTALHQAGLSVSGFVPGDDDRRGPLHEGLPTLEAHRTIAPSVGAIDLIRTYGIDQVFIGDPGLSDLEERIIESWNREGVILLPVWLAPGYERFYDVNLSSRRDSPKGFIRIEESRNTLKPEGMIRPDSVAQKRSAGSITIDNEKYLRYQGEVQLVLSDRPADERINVIGRISPRHLLLASLITRGEKFRLIPMEKDE